MVERAVHLFHQLTVTQRVVYAVQYWAHVVGGCQAGYVDWRARLNGPVLLCVQLVRFYHQRIQKIVHRNALPRCHFFYLVQHERFAYYEVGCVVGWMCYGVPWTSLSFFKHTCKNFEKYLEVHYKQNEGSNYVVVYRFEQGRRFSFEVGEVVAFQNGLGQHVDQTIPVRVGVVDFEINASRFFQWVYAARQRKGVWNQRAVQNGINGINGIGGIKWVGFGVFDSNVVVNVEVAVFF